MERAEAAAGAEQVFYLYGVIPRGQQYPREEGVPLEAVVHSDLVALVEPVSAREFSPEALDARLEDFEWVSRRALRHESVLEGAMRYGVVAPARLCTLFSSALALRQSLAANEGRFLQALERMRGREEWGVKASCAESLIQSRAGQGDARVQALDAALASATPGHAFVLRKQRDARLAELATARIYDISDEAGEALEREAVDLRLLRLLPAGEPAHGEIVVLNLAVLVDEAARESFHAAVARLGERFRDEGFRFELSGPWPPYNFCRQDDEDPATATFAVREEDT